MNAFPKIMTSPAKWPGRRAVLCLLAVAAVAASTGCKDKSVLRSPYARVRYDPSVPILWSPHYSSVSDAAAAWWSGEANVRPGRIKRIQRRFKKALPDRGAFPRHSRCAVVGDSANLLGTGYGRQIDSFPVVFRMGRAPTKGFEEDVGSKTTYHVMIPQMARPGQPAPSSTVLFYAGRIQPIEALSRVIGQRDGDRSTRGLRRFTQRALAAIPLRNIRVLHPEFLHYVAKKWFEGDGIPSAGVNTVVLALHACDDVHVFGFGRDKAGNRRRYFDRRETSGLDVSPVSPAERLVETLAGEDALTVYRGRS